MDEKRPTDAAEDFSKEYQAFRDMVLFMRDLEEFVEYTISKTLLLSTKIPEGHPARDVLDAIYGNLDDLMSLYLEPQQVESKPDEQVSKSETKKPKKSKAWGVQMRVLAVLGVVADSLPTDDPMPLTVAIKKVFGDDWENCMYYGVRLGDDLEDPNSKFIKSLTLAAKGVVLTNSGEFPPGRYPSKLLMTLEKRLSESNEKFVSFINQVREWGVDLNVEDLF